jgi:hypothetical protein
MMAQIGEVLATYWRRAILDRFAMFPAAALALGILAVAILTVAGLAESALKLTPTDAMHMELAKQLGMVICAGIVGPFLIALHFKQQIIQIRQRRIPNAVAAHVIVAVGFLVLIAVVLPAASMAIRWSSGKWSWTVLGFVIALASVTFAFYTLLMARLLILIPTFIFICCFSSGRQWLEELWQGRHEGFGLLLLVAGICGLAATLARLLNMSEEDAAYFDLSDPRIHPRWQPSTTDVQPRAASWILGAAMPAERQVQLWPQWAQGSRWQRIRLWSVGIVGIGWTFEVITLWFLTAFFIVLFSSEYVWSPVQRPSITISGSLFMMFYPSFCVVGALWQLRKSAAIESLRPVGRSQFLIEMGLLHTYRTAVAWAVLNIAWCVPAYVFVSDTPVWAHQMFNLLVLSAALQVFLFGLVVWVTRFAGPSTTGLALFALSVTAPFPPLLTQYDWRNASLSALLWVTPAILVAGALITWDAYRRWMQTELG